MQRGKAVYNVGETRSQSNGAGILFAKHVTISEMAKTLRDQRDILGTIFTTYLSVLSDPYRTDISFSGINVTSLKRGYVS